MHCDGGGSNGGPHPRLLGHGLQAGCTLGANTLRVAVDEVQNTRVNVTVTSSEDSNRASLARIQPSFKTFPETEAQPMFTQPSSKLQQSQTQQRESDSINNDDPNNLDARINFSVYASSLNCGLQARYM